MWSDLNKLPFGNGKDDPWKNLNALRLGYAYERTGKRKWGFFAALEANSLFEDDMGDSLGLYGHLGINYTFRNKVTIRFGAFGQAHKVDQLVLPYVSVSFNLGAKKGIFGDVGFPRTMLGWRFAKSWALKLDANLFSNDYYRLTSDSSVVRDGYVNMRNMYADLGMEFRPTTNLVIYGGVRYFFAREYNIYDKEGDGETTYDVDNGVGAVLNFDWRF